MLSNEKILKIASNLSSLVPETNLQNTFVICSEFFKKQSIYFSNFDKHDLIKLVIYVYLLKNGRISESKYVFENLFFAGLFMPTSEKMEEQCAECGGSGEVSCETCDAGVVTCPDCDGKSTVECEDCKGTGVDDGETCFNCDGEGQLTCAYCTDGEQPCDDCGGSSHKTCDDCRGYGEIETDKDVFLIKNIVSWDKNLRNRCELTLDTFEPTVSDDDFYIEDLLVIYQEESSYEFSWDFNSNEYYCFALSDSPTFHKMKGFNIFDESEMDYYLD